MVRISERSKYLNTENRISQMRTQAESVQENSVSGRKLHRVSQDPVGTVRVLRNRQHLDNLDQLKRTMDFAKGFMGETESALMSLNESISRTRELCVQQSNATWDKGSRMAVSKEVRQIRDHILSLANSRFEDKYIFGGFQTQQPTINAEGVYTGDNGQIMVQLDNHNFYPININGQEVFEGVPLGYPGSDPVSLIQFYNDLIVGLEENNVDTIQSSIFSLDKVLDRNLTHLATIGARHRSLADTVNGMDFIEQHLLTENNTIEGMDPIQSAMDLQRVETALNHTLQSSAKLISPHLLSFLK